MSILLNIFVFCLRFLMTCLVDYIGTLVYSCEELLYEIIFGLDDY